MYIDIYKTEGDYIFAAWRKNGIKDFNKKVHELRVNGYRCVGKDMDFLNEYEYYKKKGKKKIVTVTLMCE